jgi:hypothetical protein
MLERMRKWLDETGSQRSTIINLLTSDSVRAHKNKRLSSNSSGQGGHVHNQLLPEGGLQGALAQHKIHVVSAACPCYLALLMRSPAPTFSMPARTSCLAKW